MSKVTKIEEVMLGSDIEFFVQNIETKEIVSAEGHVKGSKHKPFNFDNSNPFWLTSLDNVAYEGNVPPIKKKEDWTDNIQKLKEYIDASLAPKKLCSVALPAFYFDEKWLNTPNAKRFGCDASYCVWTQAQNEAPETNTNLRSTGFHVHASWKDMTMETIEEFIKAMDLYAGVPSVIIEPDNERRKLYGKAGEFRFAHKNYVYNRTEYRALSGYFAKSKETIDYVYDRTMQAIEHVNNGQIIDLESPLAGEIRAAINNQDKKIAYKLVEQFNIPILA